ncbi:hypothetical protein [Methanolobus sp. WCC4]|uniref:hypothetical protein n=1 Tax=Methanolobus sp. WCC4 TaxID=3125784 RepID=UPI0030FCB14E
MKIRVFTLVAVTIMLLSIFTITAMACDQVRDREEDCTGVPDFAPRDQTRAGINADSSITEITGNSNGDCDGTNCKGDCDGSCDGTNCKGDGDCDGDGPQRDGSCQD